MKYRKHVFIILLICLICICVAIFTTQLADAKQRYKAAILTQIEQLCAQQQILLQRLGKQLIPALHAQNHSSISDHLRIFEDQNFGLAKQKLTIPINVQWVSLNIPAQILKSDGSIEELKQAQAEDFYLQIISDPNNLKISENFTRTEMPEYALVNFGLGIIDGTNNLGHLEASVALQDIDKYIRANLRLGSDWFDFILVDLHTPTVQILLRPAVVWMALGKFLSGIILLSSIFYAAIIYIYRFWQCYKQQQQAIQDFRLQIANLQHINKLHIAAADIQFKYGVLATVPNSEDTMINLNTLLQDAKTVNATLAATREVPIELPAPTTESIYMLGNRVRLMQIVSGILYEVLKLLPVASKLQMDIITMEQTAQIRQYIFRFTDNGFYTELTNNPEPLSNADIRMKGWENILRLLELEDGGFAHSHTAYNGNTIEITLTRHVASNVVNLQNYF